MLTTQWKERYYKVSKQKSMLSTNTALKLKEILTRMSAGKQITLSERVFVQEQADCDQRVSSWFTRARHLQNNSRDADSIDNFLRELDLGYQDADSTFDPKKDDLGEWFGGAPSWLGRR